MIPRSVSLAFVAFVAFGSSGCGKDANTKLCLDDLAEFDAAVAAKDSKAQLIAARLYQTCAISCDVVEDADACAAYKRVTEEICKNEGKDACQKLCDAGGGTADKPKKNEHACSAVAAMK